MATIKDVVRNALIRIQKNGQVATPDIYQEAFMEEAKKLNMDVSHYNWKNAWMRKLDIKTRQQIQNIPIKTQEDFIGVLNAVIVRLVSQDNKEHQLIYRDILSLFLRHYAFTHPHENCHSLIKETRDFFDGVSTVSPHTVRERWFQALKKDMPTESTHEESSEEKEENLSFFAPLLRPSLAQKPVKQEKMQKAYDMLQIDIQDVVKDQLVLAIEEAVQERVYVDKAFLNATLKKHSKEAQKALEVMMAKVSSMQINGEMMCDAISEEKSKVDELLSQEDNLANLKNHLMTLITATQERFTNMKEAMDATRGDIHKVTSKVIGEKTSPKGSLDRLTGVYNMDTTKDITDYQEELYVEYSQNYSVFFVDIDHFRKINEKHGEDSGDKILSNFGKLLKKIVRENDYVVRYDGEEFLVILAGMDHVESSYFAEKIRSQIEESVFVYGQHQMKVTVSVGVADRKEGAFEKMVELAKSRMQLAKKQGCNRIVS